MNLECLVLMPMRDEVKGYERKPSIQDVQN